MSATEINSQLGVEKHTLDAQEKSIKKLDIVPCGDSYPTCVFIKDSHENKKIIDEQKNKVNELTEKLNEYQNIIKEFVDSKTIEKFKEAKILTEEQKNVENRINVLNERLSSKNLSKILDEKNKLLKNLNDEKSKINSKDAERKEELTNSYKELSSAIKLHDSEKSSILVSLGSMNEKKSQFIQNKNEMNEIIEKVNIQQTIYNAFSKTGIPTMILESQLPAINQEIEKILAGVSDFGVELKTSSSSNAMDIYITHNDTKRIVETASGMEKMFCSLAIRVALSNLSSLPKSNIFIIDEGFGVLDENNIDLCLQMLQTLKNYYKTILIISHISEVKEVVDHIIEIKNNGKYSYVSN
jgi:exonuclease SbcC